jgi:hypothetical protein
MGNYVADHREELEQRHYLRKANVDDHFFDFSELQCAKNARLSRPLGDDFCVVVFSDASEDAWVMPYRDVKSVFSDQYIQGGRR